MVKHIGQSMKKTKDARKIQAQKIASELRFAGSRRTTALLMLKFRTGIEDLSYFSKNSIQNKKILDSFHGNPFPRKISDFFSIQPYDLHANTHSELTWGLFRAALYSNELSSFTILREKFEKAVILQNKETADEILNTIENQFGFSFWLLQNRLTQAQVWEGFEKKRDLAGQYVSQVDNNVLIKLLISFMSKRSESTGLKNYLQDELSRLLDETENPFLEGYIRTKLFELGQMTVSNMAATLLFDAQVSLIDHYESLVLILQAVVVDNTLPSHVADELYKFMKSNQKIHDCRLRAIERSLNKSYVPNENDIDLSRARIIEAYSGGLYYDAIDLATHFLIINPDDITICALRAKAIVITKTDHPELPGLLSEISSLFTKVMEFGKDTYGAAFALYTMHDRYYGQSWAIMARGIMNDALVQETLDFPRTTFKYLLSLDKYISPFTALSLRPETRDSFRFNEVLSKNFPVTMTVLSALLDGIPISKCTDIRLLTYRARHAIIQENYNDAATMFTDLMMIGSKLNRFHAAAYATLAYLKIGNITAAVNSVVEGALINSDVPIILPIPDVINFLDDAETWPSTISLPILFELYTSYFGEEKATHLRVSFERFQISNDISEPEQLAERISELGIDKIILYMDRVWRPEIMRQTLLYKSPKETEDARIAVCRILASIDPLNSAKYQEEIRDRVKRQEIAKGTSLVEQSKVYVDINAINKSLNSRLGDTYTRYKAAVFSKPSQSDIIVENLAEIISENISQSNVSLTNALSTLHLIDYKESELDLQFSALFAEVTNEFLKGDHGLNAYLSTRVRHGTLANTLRKPLADENLVTALKEDESGYILNDNWDNDLSILSSIEQKKIRDALEKFTSTFDKIIQHIKNDLIQIRIHHSFAGSTDSGKALFIYRSSNIERKFIQEYDKKVVSIEQFIERCIESLWEKTDVNLENVRNELRDVVRPEFLNCFDTLTDCVSTVSYPSAVSQLLNAIARARTDFQTKFHVVQSWFNRRSVYDRQDYLPEYAVQIALNMVQKTIPNRNHKLIVEIHSDSNSSLMPGRTLDGMVDVFACLLDNATIRSGLDTEKLSVNVEIAFLNGKFSATVINNTSIDRPSQLDLDKIEKVRESLNKSDSRTRAQREGGSGLHKIWRAIHSPIYKDPSFWFGFEEKVGFKAEIKYNLDWISDEISTY